VKGKSKTGTSVALSCPFPALSSSQLFFVSFFLLLHLAAPVLPILSSPVF
jgi:hypothetical protein